MRKLSLRCGILLLLCSGWGCGGEPSAAGGDVPRNVEHTDLLVFAPHPDDEALGCAGIVAQALSAGKRVRIALFTNGDGFPGAASLVTHKPVERLTPPDFLELARFRQSQSEHALAALGGNPRDLVFLGYPDAGLDQVYLARGATPFRQKFTQRTETHSQVGRDYHTARHGRSGSYTYASALADVVDLIQALRPARIYVTSEADAHPDHQAAFRFVRDGIQAAGYGGPLETYLIHGGPEWPWPHRITPESPFEAHEVKGKRVPLGVPWPPPHRVVLSPQERRLKLAAVQAHATHLAEGAQGALAEERGYLESFAKSEEVFWPVEPK